MMDSEVMELLRQLEGGGGDCADECDSIPRRGNAAVDSVNNHSESE
jgi:hypothetical protein